MSLVMVKDQCPVADKLVSSCAFSTKLYLERNTKNSRKKWEAGQASALTNFIFTSGILGLNRGLGPECK